MSDLASTAWFYRDRDWNVSINDSAYKHGLTDDDIWSVLHYVLMAANDGTDQFGRDRVLMVGPRSNGNLTEVLVLFGEEANAEVVHAHFITAHTANLFKRYWEV